MGRHLEVAVREDLAALASLVQHPQAPLVVDQETPDAEPRGALHLLDRADDLLLAAQPVADALALLGLRARRRVRRGPGTDGENELSSPLARQGRHLLDLGIEEGHDPLGLSHAVDGDAVLVQLVEERPHGAGALDAGNLEAVLRPVGEPLRRRRQVVGVSPGHAEADEEAPRLVDCGHGRIRSFLPGPCGRPGSQSA